MLTAILIIVTILLTMEILGLLGFHNRKLRNETAKKIADELRDDVIDAIRNARN